MNLRYGLKSVLRSRFKLSSPFELNDPFEMMGSVGGELSADVKKDLLQKLKPKWNDSPVISDDGRPKSSWADVIKAVQGNSAEFLRNIIMRRNSHEDRSRVLCFSRYQQEWDSRDLLLWAHYADGGRGIRVLIDVDNDKRDFYVASVVYSSLRPPLDLSLFKYWIDQDVFGPFFKQCIFTKSSIWSYEKEIRLFTSSKRQGSRFSWDGELEFISFNPAQIKMVDFGPMMKKDPKCIVEHMLSFNHLQHLKFRIAEFDSSEYKYNFVDLMK